MTKLAKGANAAAQRANAILSRIKDIKDPIVIEVGVNHGALSQKLLAARDDLTLYMVDSWKGEQEQPEHYKLTRDRNAHRPQADADNSRRRAMAIASRYQGRAKVVRMDSVEAAKHFKDECADLIFIDADHSYEGVKGDIEAYTSKTRMWIGGHDYKNPQPQFDFSGVDRAVEEAFGEVEEDLNVTWFKRLK